MKKLIMLLIVALMLTAFVAPAVVSADGSQPITVYAWASKTPVSENQALKYVSNIYANGYINQVFLSSQSTPESRMDYMRQWATKGFDPETDDAFIYSVLMPNTRPSRTRQCGLGIRLLKLMTLT